MAVSYLEWVVVALVAISSLAGITAAITFVWLVAKKISSHSRPPNT